MSIYCRNYASILQKIMPIYCEIKMLDIYALDNCQIVNKFSDKENDINEK